MKHVPTRMEKAAIAMLERGCYFCGCDGRWCFAGRHEDGCEDLVRAGMCDRHPKGLMVYSMVYATLTSNGSSVGKQMYRLNRAGKEFAERAKANTSSRAKAKLAENVLVAAGEQGGGQ